ncbi:hypothetical protein BGZ83_011060 [Gryganskiella cystojenkinii]|nr:hypothetical protein BGZ83_011060 [Gryganskiella cystojenkinii]
MKSNIPLIALLSYMAMSSADSTVVKFYGDPSNSPNAAPMCSYVGPKCKNNFIYRCNQQREEIFQQCREGEVCQQESGSARCIRGPEAA